MAVQVGNGHVVQVRRETPERWEKALARALANGLEVFQVSDTGERLVTSASRLDILHRTDGAACTCEAALAGDPVCQHRAVVRFVQGRLSCDPEATSADCISCSGCGVQDFGRYALPCETCGGSGVRQDRRPQGQPAVEVVATAA
jgi:hypothetical protein